MNARYRIPAILAALALVAAIAVAQFQVSDTGQVSAVSYAGDGSGLTNLPAAEIVGGPVLVEVVAPSDLRGVVAPCDFQAQTALESWNDSAPKEIELADLQGAALRQLVVGQVEEPNPGTCVVRIEGFTDPLDESTNFDIGTYTFDAQGKGTQQLLLPAVQATGYRLHLSALGTDVSCSGYVGVNGVMIPPPIP